MRLYNILLGGFILVIVNIFLILFFLAINCS